MPPRKFRDDVAKVTFLSAQKVIFGMKHIRSATIYIYIYMYTHIHTKCTYVDRVWFKACFLRSA